MMESSKTSAFFLIFLTFISTATPILGCTSCPKTPSTKTPVVPPVKLPPPVVPPVTLPPVKLPPVKLPPIKLPPIKLPPVVPPVELPPVVPPVELPPVVPPVVLPPVVPPVITPPVKLPPVVTPPAGAPCPSPSEGGGEESCPIDTLKLGACVDLLGGLVHVGLGDPAENECCPILGGLVDGEAALCLCTTLKLKLLNLDIFAPLVLQVLATCGKTPPKGFTCS